MRSLPVAAALALVACNAGFDPQYRVTDLRILAVKAQVEGGTTADVAPGDLLRLEALVGDRNGSASPDVSWFACPPPVDGSTPPCLDPEFLRDPVGLAGAPPYVGRVALVANVNPAIIPVPDVGAALGAAISLVSAEHTYACRLYAEIPLVVVAEAGGRREVALKTVRAVPTAEMKLATLDPTLADDYVLNANPAIYNVVSDPSDRESCTGGTPVGIALPAGRTVLCGRASPPQDFWQCGPEDPITKHPELIPVSESLSWQWYVTAGTFPDVGGQGNAMGDSIELERPADAFTLWSILRDGRGGVAWTTRFVGAAP